MSYCYFHPKIDAQNQVPINLQPVSLPNVLMILTSFVRLKFQIELIFVPRFYAPANEQCKQKYILSRNKRFQSITFPYLIVWLVLVLEMLH